MQSEQSEGTTRQVLYVSGEESEQQLYDRALRLEAAAEPGALDALLVQSTTSIDEVLHTAVQLRPACVVVDSIQTVFLDGVSGSVSGECSAGAAGVLAGEGGGSRKSGRSACLPLRYLRIASGQNGAIFLGQAAPVDEHVRVGLKVLP